MEKGYNENKEKIIKAYEDKNDANEKKIFELELLIKNNQDQNDEKISFLNNEKKNIISKLESLIEDIENKLEAKTIAFEDLETQQKFLEKQLELKNNLYKNSQADLEETEGKYSKLLELKKTADEEAKKNKEFINNYKITNAATEDSIKEYILKINESECQIEDLKQEISSLLLKIEELERQKEKISIKLASCEEMIFKLQEENRLISEENFILNDLNSKSLSKRSQIASIDSDFEKESENSLEDHEKKENSFSNFIVCRVVRHDNRLWCLVYAKNQNPEYNWYEKYILQEVNPEIQCPKPVEEELEEKISILTENNQELLAIKSFEFPEEFKSEFISKTIESLLNYYKTRKSDVAKPIKATNLHLENIPFASIESIDSGEIPDNVSESPVQVTAEEASQIFTKMKVLEEENMDLENRIMLLTQQLLYFKNEGKNNPLGKSDITIEQIRTIILSLFEKLPLQSNDIESNIKIILDIMNLNKESQDKIMEIRKIKNSPAKQSGFKKLFSKKK